jgi:predicted MFS family arabinose efflux permease
MGTMVSARQPGLAVAAGLALGPATGLGLARFAYALLLPSMRSEMHWSFAVAGAMTSANAFGYLAGALLAGPSARRWGARRGYLACTGLTVLALLATAATSNTLALAGLRAAAGLFGSVSFIAGAALAAQAGAGGPPRRAAALLSIYTAGVGAGIVITGLAVPWLLAAAPPAAGWRLGWVLLGVLAAVALAAGIPAARSCRDPTVPPAAERRWPVTRLAPLLACYALFGAGYIAFMTFIVAYLKERGSGTGLISAFWVVLGAAAIAGAFAWVPVIVRLRAARAPSVVMAVVCAAALLPLLSRSPVAALGSALLFGGSFLALVAAVMSVARRSLPAHHWTSAIATLTAAFAAGQCLGPILTGVLSDGPAGLTLGLALSAGILAAGSVVALAQRHHDATAAVTAPGDGAGRARPRSVPRRPA